MADLMIDKTGDAYKYSPSENKRRLSASDALRYAYYHARMLHGWLYGLMFLGFLGACTLCWIILKTEGSDAIRSESTLSRFVLESGVGLFAGALTGFLVIGDPLLELEIPTVTGIGRVFTWRYLLTVASIVCCALVYLWWSLYEGAQYAAQQNIVFFVLLIGVPLLTMSMIALFCALLLRNATSGALFPGMLLIADMLLYSFFLTKSWSRLLFIPYTIWGYNAADWLNNRLTLLAIGIALACISGWLLTRREERLLGSQQ